MKKYIIAHPWLFALTIIFGLASQGLIALQQVLVMDIVDALTQGNTQLLLSCIVYAVIFVFAIWLSLIVSIRVSAAYSYKTSGTLKKDVFESILNTKISDFNQGNSAKYISVLNNDVETVQRNFVGQIPDLIKFLATIALSVGAIVLISPLNALIVVAMSALPLLAPLLLGKKAAKACMENSTKHIEFNQSVKDYLTGFEVIKTFGVEKKVFRRFTDAADNLVRTGYKSGAAVTDVFSLSMAFMTAARFINYFVAGYFVLKGDITVGGVVAIVALSGYVSNPVMTISGIITSIKSTKIINKQVLDIIRQRDEKVRSETMSALEKIEVKDLSFAYSNNGQESTENKSALREISYTFNRGGKYAIVGASGSGKSTLAKLLMGYYDDYRGDILLNNHNIREVNRECLYNLMSVLHQNVFLLDDTLKNNITLYKDYSENQYENALQKANLSAVQARLPGGSDTVLGEGGNTLSGGERQRVSIARAILKGSEVMILDEATASLDNLNANEIENAILGMRDLTYIFVTHRYSKEILCQCDGILVLKDGALIETGTFTDLYDSKGYFYSLYNTFA